MKLALTATRRAVWRPVSLSVVLALASFAAGSHEGATTARLYPIGGAYDTALTGFAIEAIRKAQGPSVDIVMLPAAFADDPVLPEDPGILADDVLALQAACDAALASSSIKAAFPLGCKVSSAPLYRAVDAQNPSVVAALRVASLDGIFFTGGDQGYAMRILAGSLAEGALTELARRGALIGGTSAGAAIESLAMNAGYTDAGDSTTGLLKGAIDLWLGRPAGQRGLVFGSTRLVIDEHVYSRGRLGRMLNASAQTADAFGDGGLLGLGFDYDTGAPILADRWLGPVSGASGGVIVDFRTSRAQHRWVGADQALSARRVLTHLMPPSKALGFDLARRTPLLAGMPITWHPDSSLGLPRPQSAHKAAVVLGGGVLDDDRHAVLTQFVKLAAAAKRPGPIAIVASAYATLDEARDAANAYATALSAAGWTAGTRLIVQGEGSMAVGSLTGTAAVLFVGGNQALLPKALADEALRKAVWQALTQAPAVMFDDAMAAAAGEHYDAIAVGDAVEDDAIAAFMAGNAVLRAGLGVVHEAFESRLQTDRRWGRLYGIAAQRRQTPVYGISESSGIVLQGGRARAIGPNPVVVLDGRRAHFAKGDNGSLAAFNVLLDVYQSGEAIGGN
jgi:cyanophycinase-like exopeptidase